MKWNDSCSLKHLLTYLLTSYDGKFINYILVKKLSKLSDVRRYCKNNTVHFFAHAVEIKSL